MFNFERRRIQTFSKFLKTEDSNKCKDENSWLNKKLKSKRTVTAFLFNKLQHSSHYTSEKSVMFFNVAVYKLYVHILP